MGRRSRAAVRGAAAPAVAPNPLDERPKAPWHPFPLVELSILVGIVLIVARPVRRSTATAGASCSCSASRSARSAGSTPRCASTSPGFRSHSTLIAGVPAVLVGGVLFFAGAPQIAVLLAAVIVFAAVLRRWAAGLPTARGSVRCAGEPVTI